MKWSKYSIIFVIMILTISYIYSSIKRNELSKEVRDSALESCAKNDRQDCDIVEKYHDDCFDSSYRSELKIRSFHYQEYRACLEKRGRSSYASE